MVFTSVRLHQICSMEHQGKEAGSVGRKEIVISMTTFPVIIDHWLNLDRIYEGAITTSESGDTTTYSSVIIFGSIRNNGTMICCRVFQGLHVMKACTVLIVYGMDISSIKLLSILNICICTDRPSAPENVLVQYTSLRTPHFINISWTANTIFGMEQNYTITFDTYVSETTQQTYYIYRLNTTNVRCGTFLAFIKAVNGAGESDPSNNVSVLSLPDIGPVTASLAHQVWKHNGEIRVNISFQVRHSCTDKSFT